ncbi:MAG: hypothetical protein E7559_05230 [Ruminococcaceae bacterium]|nr:hypothetical protein [Oscillospiraceae bacterium]
MKRIFSKIWNTPELRILLKHSIFTAISTICGLALRYWLLSGGGRHTFFGHSFVVSDNAAYMVYYITGIVLLYLLKWLHADGVRGRSFLPRLIAFSALYTVSMFAGNALLSLLTSRTAIGEELAFWLTCPVTFVINFLGNRLIVFFDAENRESSKIRENNAAEEAKEDC